MQHRTLAGGQLSLSVLGFGAGPLGGLYAPIPESVANETVAAALDLGITYFDTAPLYGHGLSEHRVGTGLRGRRDGVAISTKVGRMMIPVGSQGQEPDMFAEMLPFNVRYDYSYDAVLRSFEDSLQRLGTDRVDILYIHDVNRRWHGDAVEDRFREVMAGGYRALSRLRDEGRIKAIGVGMNDSAMLARFAEAGDFDLFMLAGRYTLLDQSALDELFPVCARRGVSVVAAGPFNSGILATGAAKGAKFFYQDAPAEILDRTRRIEAVCDDHGVPLATAALQFALLHPIVVSVATGMVGADEVRKNAAGMTAAIPAGLWRDLRAAGLLHPDTPLSE